MPQRLPELEADLASDDSETVGKALDELAGVHTPEAVLLLFHKSGDEKFSAAHLAREAFERSVRTAPKIALWHPESDLRKAAIECLSRGKVTGAIPELARVLSSKMAVEIRCLSAEALGTIGQVSCIPILSEARQDSNPEIRAAALHGLQNIMQLGGEQAVIGFLDDHDWSLRQDAKEHLERTGWVPETSREKALWAIILGRFDEAVAYGSDSVDVLVDATLHVNDSEVRRWSAIALTRLNSSVAARRLQKALKSDSSSERQAALDALEILGEAADTEGLSEDEVLTDATSPGVNESVFVAASRMLTIVGHL